MPELEKKTLNEWRVLRGMEVLELAELTSPSVGSYLYQGVVPLVPTALKLAEVLGVDVSQIIWGRLEHPANVPDMPKSPPYDPKRGLPIISDEQLSVMVQWAAAGRDKQDIVEAMGVSRPTFYKALERYEEQHGPVLFKRGRARKSSNLTPQPHSEGA